MRVIYLNSLHVSIFKSLNSVIIWFLICYHWLKQKFSFRADINACNKGTQWTALHCAAFQGHGKVIMKLMEHNPSVELKDNQGRYIPCTCTSLYILHDSKTSLIYQIKSSTAVRFILHKTHSVCITLHLITMF